MKYDIFLSYRRDGGFDTAKHLYDLLIRDGYSVSFDVDTLRNGDFDVALFNRIKSCKDFILILDEHAFDRTLDENFPREKDWLRMELACALEHKINVIPVMLSGFSGFPDNLPEDIADITRKNGPGYNREYFDAFYLRLLEFLTSSKSNGAFNRSVPWKKRSVLAALLISAIILLGCFGTKYLMRSTSKFKYSKGGLTLTVKGLTDIQINALRDIMDQMVYVNDGFFTMGLNADTLMTPKDEASIPAHKVGLSAYYISSCEITQAQWLAFSKRQDVIQTPGLNLPVDYCSWENAAAFADTLSRITGLNFSLPTEAQWEFAAKGGKLTKGYLYSGSNAFTEVSWLKVSENSAIHPVGKLTSNELGLFDMTGNVAEWCLDHYSPYTPQDKINPTGPIDGQTRVFRGGNIHTLPFEAKVSTRSHYFPNIQRRATGFRLVINL